MKPIIISLFFIISPLLIFAQQISDYPINQVPYYKVKMTEGFWYDRLETNARVTLWHNFQLCEETSRIDNFSIAGGLKDGEHIGIFFNDSDVFKAIEGAAYSYALNQAEISFNGIDITLEQHTQFPWDGEVDVLVTPSRSQNFKMKLRIPGWARNQPYPSDLYTVLNKQGGSFMVFVNGSELDQYTMDHGYLIIDRKWKKGDKIQISFPMDVLRIVAHKNVEDNRGKVALQRGPVVYCAEAVDNNGTIYNLVLSDESSLTANYKSDQLGGVSIIEGDINAVVVNESGQQVKMEKHAFKAVPYYTWSNRGPGEMAVWLPRKINSIKINP